MLFFQGKSKGIKQHAVMSSLAIEKAEITTEVQIKITKKKKASINRQNLKIEMPSINC